MAYVSRVPGIKLAYEFLPGDGPVIVFCPGYASDMTGTKALALEAWCKTKNRSMLRFDYAGHGRSGGVFSENGISDWAKDAAFVIEHVAVRKDIILVGSSMGGWISLLLGKQLKARLKALVLIAPAPDFTKALLEHGLTPEQRTTLLQTGVVYQPSEYGAPLLFSKALIDRSTTCLVMDDQINITCPIRILHGMKDASVPWELSLKLVEKLAGTDIELIYVKNGDHRLSEPQDLVLLERIVASLLG